ncbi:MAG TPA: hypothetical protein V6C69_03595 [Trichormus sp.]|jgi:hypothetical protein
MRIIAFTLALIGIYQIVIWTGWLPTAAGVTGSDENRILAEQWKYHTTPGDIFVVGSSRVQRMPQAALGPDIQKLYFFGSNSVEATTLLTQLKTPPRYVVVEITPANGESDDQLCQLGDKRVYALADSLSALRQEYRPVGVLFAIMCNFIRYAEVDPTPEERKISFHRSMINLCDNPNARARERRNQGLEKLKGLVMQLQARGSRVIMFRQPGDAEIESGCAMRTLTEDSHRLFPSSQFEWLPQPAGEWHTGDGLHMRQKDEQLYTAWLGAQIHAIVNQKLAHTAAKTL